MGVPSGWCKVSITGRGGTANAIAGKIRTANRKAANVMFDVGLVLRLISNSPVLFHLENSDPPIAAAALVAETNAHLIVFPIMPEMDGPSLAMRSYQQ
jgi:hypothetical protein